MYLVIVFLLILLSSGKSEQQCTELEYKTVIQKCTIKNANCQDNNTQRNINYRVLNDSLGHINIIADNYCKRRGTHFLKLFVNETATKESCKQVDANDDHLHTQIQYEINDASKDDYKKCPDELNLETVYVFTGCYILRIENGRNTWISKPTYIATTYEKRPLKDANITLQIDFRNGTLEMTIREIEEYVYKSPGAQAALTKYGGAENFSGIIQVCNCLMNRDCSLTSPFKYKCTFYELQPGYYSFYFHFPYNIQCNPTSLWNPSCILEWNFEVTEKDLHLLATETTTIDYDDKNTSYIYITFITLGTLLAALILCVYVIYNKKFVAKNPTIKILENNPLLSNNFDRIKPKQILLLYFKDSTHFMQIISNLKQLFIQQNITVADIYENDEKLLHPQRWLEEKLSNKEIKVLLVLNETASTIADCQNGWPVIHELSSFCDKLFLYAIDLLRLEKKTYTNLYVIQTIPIPNLNYLNGLTRYTMPDHFTNLLHDLNIRVNDNEPLITTFKDSCVVYQQITTDFVI